MCRKIIDTHQATHKETHPNVLKGGFFVPLILHRQSWKLWREAIKKALCRRINLSPTKTNHETVLKEGLS
jgi:hypothetical protein